jgi:hypothetical protein
MSKMKTIHKVMKLIRNSWNLIESNGFFCFIDIKLFIWDRRCVNYGSPLTNDTEKVDDTNSENFVCINYYFKGPIFFILL